MDRLNKRITYQQYEKIKNKLDEELCNKRHKYINNNNIILEIDSINRTVHNYLSFDYISRELIVNIVDKIELFSDKRICISFSFLNNLT